MVTFVSGKATVPVLLIVTVLAALVVLMVWLAKATAVGVTAYVGTTTLPVKEMDCEVAGVATVMFSV
jgi:hypothetical protein